MKYTFLIILFFLSIQTVMSQNTKTIEIYYFDELDAKNEEFLNDLWDRLDRKKNKFKLIMKYSATSIKI